VFPGGFYDVRWFRVDDRGKLVEITRERFQLRNHSVGRTRSVSRIDPRLAAKALPTSGRGQATQSGRGPLADQASPHWAKVAGAVLCVLLLPVAGALLALKQARGWHFG
jgi:hypothetical protein